MIKGLNHITLAVSDLDTSFSFYTSILDCQPLAKWSRGAYLLAGDVWLCLSVNSNTHSEPQPDYTHLAFSVDLDEFERWRSRLAQHHVSEWKQNTSEGDSIYFLDPDGHKLELHIGDWRSRLAATKNAPYDNMEFFV